jgi:hypothetical protein
VEVAVGAGVDCASDAQAELAIHSAQVSSKNRRFNIQRVSSCQAL